MKHCINHRENKAMEFWEYCPICGNRLIEVREAKYQVGVIAGMPVLTPPGFEGIRIVSAETLDQLKQDEIDKAFMPVINNLDPDSP